jgi:alkylation response protein AidB-like acyl-CoA dehydrogenase
MTDPEVIHSLEVRIRRLVDEFPPSETSEGDFLGAQYDAGLAFIDFPEGHGGLELPRQLSAMVTDRLAEAGAPMERQRNVLGYSLAAPSIATFGTEEQRRRYLRRIFVCEEIWCQLFSEPGAGSDLAGLATRAQRDGDEWVVNGQKVWTTLAHTADLGMLVARTDQNTEKYSGLTYFILDMHAPGVEVRPLRQMTGDAEFNEMYFTDVRIPDSCRLGDVGRGWNVALVTLMNERNSIAGTPLPRGSGPISLIEDIWRHLRPQERTAVRRDHYAQLWMEAEVLRMTRLRADAAAAAGVLGPEGSLGKLAKTEIHKRIFEFCVDLLGPQGLIYDSYEMRRPEFAAEIAGPARNFLRSRAQSIEGGTSEVQRNIIAERLLGLPRDPRVDKGLPWTDIPRN